MPAPYAFTVRVACYTADGQRHEHELEIAGAKPPLGMRAEGACEMQYTCPRSGQDRKASIECRADVGRPYRVVRVT